MNRLSISIDSFLIEFNFVYKIIKILLGLFQLEISHISFQSFHFYVSTYFEISEMKYIYF